MALTRPDEDEEFVNQDPTRVGIRLMFRRIGEIDTLNEKYQAQASLEARWTVELGALQQILSSSDRRNFNNGKSVSLVQYGEKYWHPQLFIENALGDTKEQIRFSAKKVSHDTACICEHREIKGVFWEKLELHHFPSDVQELQISVGSMYYDDRVILTPDPNFASGVNREAFVDQQEWSLYEHVNATQRFVGEFFPEGGDRSSQEASIEERKRSFVSVSCNAARRSAYFYWNGYFLVFLITVCSFCIFSMPPSLPQNRLQTGATLLLTSITFRWTVNRSLPTISYLTTLDKYSIISIFMLIVLCVWHAIIGAIIYIDGRLTSSTATDRNSWIDRGVFIGLFSFYIIMHIAMIIWLYRVPFAHKRLMERKDAEYRQKLRNQASKQSMHIPTYMNDPSNRRKKKLKYTMADVELE